MELPRQLYLYEPFVRPDEGGHRHFFRLAISADGVGAEMTAWCKENFGERPDRSDGARWWHMGGDYVWIRDEADAFQFRLRWC
jgi:hypothetical protein